MNQVTNQLLNQHLSGAQAQNLSQEPTIVAIHAEPRMKDVNIGIVTHVGATTSDDGPR